jgi:hypothetical protein
MKKDIINYYFNKFRFFLLRLGEITLYIIFIFVLILIVVDIIKRGFVISPLHYINEYVRIILGSWPASALIIACLLLILQKDAIDEFIRKRLISIGPNGVSATSTTTVDASVNEIATKTIKDVKEAVVEENNSLPEENKIEIEENVQKIIPNSKNQAFVERFKRVRSIEELTQVYLMAKYGESYKPNIKLLKDNKSIILDGLLKTKKGKFNAIEIRYIGENKHSEALKYIIIKLKSKLWSFGIRKLSLIVVANELVPSEALKIKEQLSGLADVMFYNLNNDKLEDVFPEEKLNSEI